MRRIGTERPVLRLRQSSRTFRGPGRGSVVAADEEVAADQVPLRALAAPAAADAVDAVVAHRRLVLFRRVAGPLLLRSRTAQSVRCLQRAQFCASQVVLGAFSAHVQRHAGATSAVSIVPSLAAHSNTARGSFKRADTQVQGRCVGMSERDHLVRAHNPDRQALLARHLQRFVHGGERLVLALLLQWYIVVD